MGSITVAQTPLVNGHTTYGKIAIGSIVNEEQKEANAISKLTPGQDSPQDFQNLDRRLMPAVQRRPSGVCVLLYGLSKFKADVL
jgi:hypothetical protein